MTISTHEGFIVSYKKKVWYKIYEPENLKSAESPILILHGGPGVPHDYLEPLSKLAESGRHVIFYDQLGCGNSETPDDSVFFTKEYFLEEIDTVRHALKLDSIHILGHSWGGMLALEYAIKQPAGLKSLIISDSLASAAQWKHEADRLRQKLPSGINAVLLKHEKEGTTDAVEYQDAMKVYYKMHVCRLDPWPECLNRASAKFEKNPEVYLKLWGPGEFCPTGILKDWDITHLLHKIYQPTLILGGRYDEATPRITATLQDHIPNSQRIIFEKSAHVPHLEEPEKYIQTVNNFLENL